MRTTEPGNGEDARPRIGVAALVFDHEQRLLLIRRATLPSQGFWSIPGGKQETGETLVTACMREVFEETGLKIVLGPIVAVVERIDDRFHYVIIDFLAKPKHFDCLGLTPSGDVSDARWVEIQNLAEYELVEGLEAIIQVAIASQEYAGGLKSTRPDATDFVADLVKVL